MSVLSKLTGLKKYSRNTGTRLFATSVNSENRTPIANDDIEDKENIINYLNNSRSELVHLLHTLTDVRVSEQVLPIVDDVFEQGLVIRYFPENAIFELTDSTQDSLYIESIKKHAKSETIFVPFRIQDASLHDRVYYLFYESLAKQDRLEEVFSSKDVRHYFEVTGTHYVTKNMLRIYIRSDEKLPANDPGYVYRFVLIILDKNHESVRVDLNIRQLFIQVSDKISAFIDKSSIVSNIYHRTKKIRSIAMLEVLKRLPEKQRDKLTADPPGALLGRAYTLRQLKKNSKNNEYSSEGEVDIYIHENSPGSEWAKSLKAGDIIYADKGYEESIKTMTTGQPFFLCDETSMPAVAAMLERWQSETVPIVISITNEDEDFRYFDEMLLPEVLQESLKVSHINGRDVDDIAQEVIKQLEGQNKKIDCAWGAIGVADFKPIKKYLREEHGLMNKQTNRIRAYWG